MALTTCVPPNHTEGEAHETENPPQTPTLRKTPTRKNTPKILDVVAMNYITVPEFARRAAMHQQTVRSLIANGHVKAHQTMPNSPYKIPETELDRFLTPNCGVNK